MRISREFKIGLLVVVSLAGAVWGLNVLKGRNIFRSVHYYYAIYDDINGLAVSNPVKAYGFKVGKVSNITYLPDGAKGHLLVEMRIENNDIRIPKDSKALIRSSDLLGSREITIQMGQSSEFLKPGDTLHAMMEKGLSEQVNAMLAPLKVKVEHLLGSVDTIVVAFRTVFDEKGMKNITTGIAGIRTSIENIVEVTNDIKSLINSEKGKISAVVSNMESITSNLRNSNKSIFGALSNMNAAADSLRQMRLGTLGRTLNQTALHLDSLATHLRAGRGTLGRLIISPALHNDLDSTLRTLNSLLEEIKNRPGEYITVSLFGRRKKLKTDIGKDKQK
ncbi:MAG: MlaD family protein [Flavobacteriales bacterium]|nr:MlaD family protein [Flavobacteriales bacterium]MCX7768917.1 MlaD family protein [Flavobacteriales bacterium]MDW8409958.1 MlaD family protein [Flavobacteriales bacterium]